MLVTFYRIKLVENETRSRVFAFKVIVYYQRKTKTVRK